MSLKSPYLDVRGLSAEESYKLISDNLNRHFAYQNKKAFPKYRFQQILNAINHAPLTDADKKELRSRVQQLRDMRNAAVQSLKEVQALHYQTSSIIINKSRVSSSEPKPTKRMRIRPQFQTREMKYVGRVNNFEKRILSIKTSEEAETAFDKILRQRPAFSVNELNSTIELCQKIENQAISKRLISLLSSLLKNTEERLDKSSRRYVEQMKKKPTNKEFVKIVHGGSPGLGKR